MAVCTALALGACGGGSDKEAQQLAERSIAKVRPLSEVLVSREDITKEREGSVRRTFFSFWATLQFQAWDEAENYFADGLRSAIGTGLLVDGLEAQAAAFRTSKPEVRAVTTTRGRATVHFIANDSEGSPTPLSITWTRVSGGLWRIVFFPALNAAFSFAAQQRKQMEVAPLATTPPPEAVKAGYDAGHIQSRYLARQRAGATTTLTPGAVTPTTTTATTTTP